MKVSIRKATPEDLDAIWHMWNEIMHQKIYYPYDDSYSRQDIEDEWINLVNNHPYVAVDKNQQDDDDGGGTIAGAYILKSNQPGYGQHICNAAYMVQSTHRGKGIGDELCRHSLEMAKREGYRGIQFNLVVSTNQAAIRIWKRNGFEMIGTVPGGFYHEEMGEYVDAYIFYKSLVEANIPIPQLLSESDGTGHGVGSVATTGD